MFCEPEKEPLRSWCRRSRTISLFVEEYKGVVGGIMVIPSRPDVIWFYGCVDMFLLGEVPLYFVLDSVGGYIKELVGVTGRQLVLNSIQILKSFFYKSSRKPFNQFFFPDSFIEEWMLHSDEMIESRVDAKEWLAYRFSYVVTWKTLLSCIKWFYIVCYTLKRR